MRNEHRIAVIIPALNEAASIGKVIEDIPDWVDTIIVADNGSEDGTPDRARDHGAQTVVEPRRGYGSACLAGIAALPPCDVVVFLDGDYSDYPAQMDRLVDPIVADEADMVIGSRTLGEHEPGALTPQQRFGNGLACWLMRVFWGARYTDLGPFRAIRATSLTRLGMRDPDYGWTVEMQIKAILHGLRTTEAPVDYRNRIGKSKVSGTVRGVVGAGTKILGTIFLCAFRHYLGRRPLRQRLVVFTRYPVPGETKTRLIPGLGAEGAAELQRKLTEYMLEIADAVPGVDVEIRYTGADEGRMRAWLGDHRHLVDQGDGDLGDRMRRALTRAAEDGVDATVIVGIDCPDVSPEILASAFRALRTHGLVLGPATDGGYYLIGASQPATPRIADVLFDDMPWGTDTVYHETMQRTSEANIDVHSLVPLRDIDVPEDVALWDAIENPESRPRISVVIPALNEGDSITGLVRSISGSDDIEVIVVDGGSVDETAERARANGAVVIRSERGRARQMNEGAAHAKGSYLVFLHADTTIPADFAEHVKTVLAHPNTVLGAFRFATDDASTPMRCIAYWTNLRARLLQMPYGDQTLFIARDDFRAIGGFPPMPIMEDFVFVRRAKRHGKVEIADAPAVTSARRWQRIGPWKTMVYNQLIILGYFAGIDPTRLARFYRRTHESTDTTHSTAAKQ